jgi:hypothetical protein
VENRFLEIVGLESVSGLIMGDLFGRFARLLFGSYGPRDLGLGYEKVAENVSRILTD